MTIQEEHQIIAEIRKLNPRLNDWERGFLESVEPLINKGYRLTEKQDDSLIKIYDKATGGGRYQRRQYV